MKKALLILLAFALVFGLVFTGCPNGSTGSRQQDPPVVDNSLKDLVVDGAEIVLKSCGNAGKPEHVSGNKFKLVDQDSLDNVGFYWEFPEEVVGKGYGAINIEMEVISIENPDFIGFMTHSTSSINSAVNVIDKKTGQPKTGQYDHEFKLGEECEKGDPRDTAEGGDGIVDGSSKAGVKHDESYPFAKFKDVIAFQVNKYAGNITTPTWSSSTGKATFEIAVTKVTFVGGAVPDSVVDEKAITGVTPPASGVAPVTSITNTKQYTGTVAWKGAGGTAVGATFADGTIYTATITLEAEDGFTFEGVAADFFTVAGATTVTNDKDSGVVTAVFPATQAPATALTVTVAGTAKQTTSLTGWNAIVTLLNDGTGLELDVDKTADDNAYDHTYFVFKLNLGEALTGFASITFDVVGTTYKEVWARAGNVDITGYKGSTAQAVLFEASGTNTLTGGPGVTLAINSTEAGKVTGNDLFFAIDVRIGANDGPITITDIKFVK